MHSRDMFKCRSNDAVDAERLVSAHLRLVRPIANNIRANLPAHVELNDLIQDGMCGLIGAARRYNTRRGVPFPLYAKHRIRGAILDGLRRVDPATRGFRSKVKKLEAAAHELGDELGGNPTEAEVAAGAGTAPHESARDHVTWRPCEAIRAGIEARGAEPCDLSADETWRPDVQARHEELSGVLLAAMNSLPARYRQIMLLYHWRGVSMREIGVVFGVNESRVSQIHKRALELMAGTLRSSGITSSAALLA